MTCVEGDECETGMPGCDCAKARGLEPVRRPDGRLYRPRKIRTVLLNLDEPALDPEVAVLGTHNEAVAQRHARAEVQAYDRGLDVVYPMRTWLRQAVRNNEPYYEVDRVRGAAAVLFKVREREVTWT